MCRNRNILTVILILFFISCEKEPVPEGELVQKDTLVVNITHNPIKIAPLSAGLKAYSTKNVKLAVIIKGKNEDDLEYPVTDLKKHHEFPIIGLYPNHNNEISINIYGEDGQLVDQKIHFIQTDSINVDIPEIFIITNNTGINNHTLTFVEFRSAFNVPIIFDEYGEIRWYLKIDEITREPFVSKGNPFLFSGSKIRTYFYKYNWLGKTDTFALPQKFRNLHHDFCFAENSFFAPVTGDNGDAYIAEFDYNGYLVRDWNMNEILKSYLPLEQDLVVDDKDWAHINYIELDESSDALIVSFRKKLGVVKMGYGSGDIKWILADTNMLWYTYPELKKLALMPVNNCELPLGQHSPVLLKNGNIIMFDNGFENSDIIRDGLVNGGKGYSRLVEYSVNENDRTVSQAFEYGKERGKELYSILCGNVDYDEKNNLYLIDFGLIQRTHPYAHTEGRIVELTPAGQLAFEAKLRSTGPRQLFFRAEKIDLDNIINKN